LRNDAETMQRIIHQGQQPLTEQDGERMKLSIGALQYLECSALTGQGLKDVFDTAIRIAIKGTRGAKPSKKSGSDRMCQLL